MRAAFAVESNWIEIGVPGSLKSISEAAYKRQVAKQEAGIASLAENIKNAMRVQMADLVDHLTDRLSKKTDGTQKIFRNSLVGNVKDFLEVFNNKNIVNDTELATLVSRAAELMEGVDPDDLRSNEQMRAYVRDGFNGIKDELDSMLINRPARVIDFAEAQE